MTKAYMLWVLYSYIVIETGETIVGEYPDSFYKSESKAHEEAGKLLKWLEKNPNPHDGFDFEVEVKRIWINEED